MPAYGSAATRRPSDSPGSSEAPRAPGTTFGAAHGDDRSPATQHPARGFRSGASAVLAPDGRLAPLARPAPGRWHRVHQLLHPFVALLAQPGQHVHRPLPGRPRGRRQRDHARAPRAADDDPDTRVTAAGRRLSLLLYRQVAPLPLPHTRHGGLRLRRLGRQRPPLHGLGRHRRAFRPHHRHERRPLDREERVLERREPRQRQPGNGAGRPLVSHRRPGQPARRDVVPGRPARLPRSAIPTR